MPGAALRPRKPTSSSALAAASSSRTPRRWASCHPSGLARARGPRPGLPGGRRRGDPWGSCPGPCPSTPKGGLALGAAGRQWSLGRPLYFVGEWASPEREPGGTEAGASSRADLAPACSPFFSLFPSFSSSQVLNLKHLSPSSDVFGNSAGLFLIPLLIMFAARMVEEKVVVLKGGRHGAYTQGHRPRGRACLDTA